MKRFKVLGLTLMAVLALASVLSATASALPELLGQAAGEEYKGKNTVANPKLETVAGEKITCTAATASGKQTNDTTGTFDIDFTGCKAETAIGNFACNTAGDAKEVILSTGATDYVSPTKKGEDKVSILFLPAEVTIECTALVKLKVRGHLVCPVSTPLGSTATHEFVCTQTKGVQAQSSFFNDEEKSTAGQHLETSKNGGAFEESGEGASASFTFGVAVAFMNE